MMVEKVKTHLFDYPTYDFILDNDDIEGFLNDNLKDDEVVLSVTPDCIIKVLKGIMNGEKEIVGYKTETIKVNVTTRLKAMIPKAEKK
jgi:hypothetical protein